MAIIDNNKNMVMADGAGGARYDAPGAAWVWNNSQGTWVQPPQPGDENMNYSWDDERGWIGTKKPPVAGSSSGKTVSNAIQNADGSITIVYSDGTTELKSPSEGTAKTLAAKAAADAAATAAADAAAKATQATADATLAALQQSAAMAAASKAQNQQNAISFLTSTFNDYGLGGDIAGAVTNLVQQGYNSDTIQLMAQDPKGTNPIAIAFQQRFPANAARLAAGLPVLSPGAYLDNERQYAQIMGSYGLSNDFATNKDIFTKLITNDISPTELNSRINTAKQVVENTDPAVAQQLQQYYGLTQGDMIAHVLDPKVATPIIEKQISTAQIGAEAARYGANIDQSYAQQLSNLGVTQAQANQGFQSIAQSQQGMQELATRYDAYGPAGQIGQQLQAATFGTTGAASATEELNRLKMQEVSQFSGSSGAGKGSLMGTEAGLS
jgi:hypothetical protein